MPGRRYAIATLACLTWLLLTARVAAGVPDPGLQYTALEGSPVSVDGLPAYPSTGSLARLDVRGGTFRGPVELYGRYPKGGRLRFLTDSPRLHLAPEVVALPEFSPGMSLRAAHGLDVYVDGRFLVTALLEEDKVLDIPQNHDGKVREITVYLPPFAELRPGAVGMVPGSRLLAPPVLANRIVFFGTSIEWGGGQARHSVTYPEVLGRELGVETVNLSFPANAWGEDEVASALAEIPAKVFVLGHVRNLRRQALNYLHETVSANLARITRVIKARQPAASVVLLSPLYLLEEAYNSSRAQEQRSQLAESRRAYSLLSVELPGMAYVNLHDLPSHAEDDDAFSDPGHPNAMGHRQIARRLAPVLRGLLTNAP